MNPYVCIVVSDILLQDLLVKRYEAAPVEGGEGIFAGKISSEEETPLVIVSISSPEKRDEVLRQVFDNYQIQKVVLTSLVSTPHLDGDLKVGDVIIPNTYIDANGENPMFLEYAIGDNYDLQKFGLILSGVCQFGEATDDATDVVDAMTYPVLQYLQEKDMISNTVSIQIVGSHENSPEEVEHILHIIDLML